MHPFRFSFATVMGDRCSVTLCSSNPQWILPETSVSLWCYVFYASKYYELLDTLFILLKNKKPRFVQASGCPQL
jgi:hypothetical protein